MHAHTYIHVKYAKTIHAKKSLDVPEEEAKCNIFSIKNL